MGLSLTMVQILALGRRQLLDETKGPHPCGPSHERHGCEQLPRCPPSSLSKGPLHGGRQGCNRKRQPHLPYASEVRHPTARVRGTGIKVVDNAGPGRFVDRMALEELPERVTVVGGSAL